MHPQQKAAWYVLVVISGTFALYCAAIPAFSWWFHRSMAEAAAPALGLFGLLGLTGLETLFYKSSNEMAPAMDERDWLLARRAWTTGMAIFWLLFCTAGVGIWVYLYYLMGLDRVTMPVFVFPVIIGGAAVIFMFSKALAILHLYGWKADDGGR